MEILLTILIFGVLVAGMAIGVIMGRKPIAGSCGGGGTALGEEDYVCEICGGDPIKCENSTEQEQLQRDSSLAYDPMALDQEKSGLNRS